MMRTPCLYKSPFRFKEVENIFCLKYLSGTRRGYMIQDNAKFLKSYTNGGKYNKPVSGEMILGCSIKSYYNPSLFLTHYKRDILFLNKYI